MSNTDIAFTVIIPALNEALWIEKTIRRIKALNPAAQIIVADGGSTDSTLDLSRKEGARVVLSQRGRGLQCNAGAMKATGDVLLFLHADTCLPPDAFEIIAHCFKNKNMKIGTFRLAFDQDSAILRFYSKFTRFDSIFTRFGDQCIVVRKSFFLDLGGFPDWPLFEDVHLLRLARQRTRIVSFPASVITSARRFLALGLIRTQLLNGWFLLLYFFGVSPILLANWYTGTRNEGVNLQPMQNEVIRT